MERLIPDGMDKKYCKDMRSERGTGNCAVGSKLCLGVGTVLSVKWLDEHVTATERTTNKDGGKPDNCSRIVVNNIY